MEKRVIGIGGIFFKCQEAEKTRDWYRRHLGLNTNEYGTSFEFRNVNRPEEKNYLQWSTFKADTEYMNPGKAEFMVNYRVEDLEKLVEVLEQEGVQILDEIQVYEYGKFAHILDPEGNKIELWEANNAYFEKIAGQAITR